MVGFSALIQVGTIVSQSLLPIKASITLSPLVYDPMHCRYEVVIRVPHKAICAVHHE